MNSFWVVAAIGGGILAEIFLVELAFRRGYHYGQQDGYDTGLKDGKVSADNWWIRAEEQTDQERVKIWKEGV